jgi:hypothetical protein
MGQRFELPQDAVVDATPERVWKAIRAACRYSVS